MKHMNLKWHANPLNFKMDLIQFSRNIPTSGVVLKFRINQKGSQCVFFKYVAYSYWYSRLKGLWEFATISKMIEDFSKSNFQTFFYLHLDCYRNVLFIEAQMGDDSSEYGQRLRTPFPFCFWILFFFILISLDMLVLQTWICLENYLKPLKKKSLNMSRTVGFINWAIHSLFLLINI